MFATAFALFAAAVGLLAVHRTAGTWGSVPAGGLALGLLATWFVLPLGGLLTIAVSVGGIVFADREGRRRLSS